MNAPDVLVLGGGGLLGEAWMSAVLAGMQDGADLDARRCASFIGTSAGSIVAVSLAAGVDPHENLGAGARGAPTLQTDTPVVPAPRHERAIRSAIGLGASALAPLAALTLGSKTTAAAGALARRVLLAGIPLGRRSLSRLGASVERLHASWDGRLQVAAVDLRSGRRVMFGAPGAPAADLSQAVQASCAIPGVFRPVEVDGRSYVDGGVWSPTNMDCADVHSRSRVVCLNPTGSLRPTPRSPAAALGAVSRTIAATEGLALRRRGADVRVINPDEACRRAMGLNFFDARRRRGVIEAGIAQGRREGAALARAG